MCEKNTDLQIVRILALDQSWNFFMTLGKSFLRSGFKLHICKMKQLFEISSISELTFINICLFFRSNRR